MEEKEDMKVEKKKKGIKRSRGKEGKKKTKFQMKDGVERMTEREREDRDHLWMCLGCWTAKADGFPTSCSCC